MNIMNLIMFEYNFIDFNDGNYVCCFEVYVMYYFFVLCILYVFIL